MAAWLAKHPEPLFLGLPESWYEAGLFRCDNGHVSRTVLKSEALGRDACLECRAPIRLTHPGDHDDEEGERHV